MKTTPLAPPKPAAVRDARRGMMAQFFFPGNIAVIGASEKAGSVGRALLENLRAFKGCVFPVNPKHTHLLGTTAFPRVTEVPVEIDLALIASPAETVPQVVRECAEAGVKAAIIHSAGFKECGPHGAKLEREILDAARRGGVRILGPNCLGLMAPHQRLNATFALTMARPGNVGFISQSGALCAAVLDWSRSENVGFSALVSVGSMLDVGWGELITTLGDDVHTRSILIYMESIGDARSFLSAAREVALTKPIIVVKAGRSEAASRAAASHTGALTGSDAVIDAAFRRAGVLRVDTIEDLFDMAEALGKQPRPAGPRLGIVTNAGGPAALAVDRLVAAGGQVATLTKKTLAALDALLPAHWSHGNPVDVLGDADDKRFAKAVEIVGNDEGSDGVLVVLTPQAMTDPLAAAVNIEALAAQLKTKPLLASWMGGAAVEAGESVLNKAGIPTFKFPDRAAEAFAHMWRYSANLEALYETPALMDRGKLSGDVYERVDRIIQAARRRHRVILTEYESKEILAAHGIPVVNAFPALNEDEAVELAAKLGYPVAVKLHSETVTHKSSVGGVRLDVRDAAGVREAWRTIKQSVAEKAGKEHFLGVSVERMIPSDGHEFILGSTVDAQFGPVILFGAGGRLVEVLQDRAIGLPPLNSTLARRLMEQTRLYLALRNRVGNTSIDWPALEGVLVRFSQLVAGQKWIKEIDVNPLLVAAGQILALDARVILHDASMAEDRLPVLAIRPYPKHYSTSCTLTDGTSVLLRAIRPEDEPMMAKFHATLSDQSVYFRFFTPLSLKQRTSHGRLARNCFIDYDREVALVAVRDDPVGEPEIIGVARLCKEHGRNESEFAIVVADRWQRRGLGTQLLTKLIAIGREERLARITGTLLADNYGMRRVCEKVGFLVRHCAGEPEFEATITL